MPTALLIIDVQNILCAGASKARDVDDVISRINIVSRKARAAGALVVVIQHETTNGEMDYGTENWKLAPSLELHGTDVLLRKTASDAFLGTALSEILASRAITKLIVCGLQSEFCVDSTVRRAMALGYPVVLVADGHTTVDNGVLLASQIAAHHNKTLSNIESYGPRTTAVVAAEVQIAA
jgi:nicotinamidase-related amidase